MFQNLFENINKRGVVAICLFIVVIIGALIYAVLQTNISNDSQSDDDRQQTDIAEYTETEFTNPIYSISNPVGNSATITITAPSGYRSAAVTQLYNQGFDPTNYTINFSNYESPFKAYE